MPLSANILKNEIRKVIDDSEEFSEFIPYPEGDAYTSVVAALRWVEAVDRYFGNFIAPGLVQVTGSARALGKTALQTTWTPLFALAKPPVIPPPILLSFQKGFPAYISAITTAMTATDPIYDWLPPAGEPSSFKNIFESAEKQSKPAEQVAEEIAEQAHSWMRTGNFKLKATPFTVIPWITSNPE